MRDLDFGKELIRKKIPLVSNSPGVYRMLDKKNQVLYVGKAKNLPNRLKSYAQLIQNLTGVLNAGAVLQLARCPYR